MHDYSVHTLTVEELMVWGTCPVCEAPPGEKCYPEVGLSLGSTVHGKPPTNGVHIGRLNAAPKTVRLQKVS